ncbi:MAG: aspartate dehydrogenase [Lachnospiraceae bacterium]|nr:aspartate dehydrogenase [Lachnospiraceae bacterium]
MHDSKAYDPAVYKPVLKCSICNGERVAGFKNRQTGKFEEVVCIKNDRELEEFLRQYGLDHIDKEY